MPRRRRAGQVQPAIRETFLGRFSLEDRQALDTVTRAEPELRDLADAFFREELGLSRTRVRARAVAKVAADMVAWMCLHKLHMDDEKYLALLPAYRDALARAVAGEPEATTDQLLLLGDSFLVWAANWSDDFIWKSQRSPQKDLDAAESIRRDTDEQIKHYQSMAKHEAELLGRLMLNSS